MNPRILPFLIFGAFICGAKDAAAIPRHLYGKSVVVTWSEDRIQRDGGVGAFRPVTAAHNLSVYMSTAGRPFARMTNTTRAGSGSTERAPHSGGGRISTSFSGQTLVVIIGGTGNARRATITFSGDYAACTAQLVRAKPVGSAMFTSTSIITGQLVETKSVTVRNQSCSIREGNVFAP